MSVFSPPGPRGREREFEKLVLNQRYLFEDYARAHARYGQDKDDVLQQGLADLWEQFVKKDDWPTDQKTQARWAMRSIRYSAGAQTRQILRRRRLAQEVLTDFD